jgi:GST-like protein
MIELHTSASPNGWKISVMLEECGLPYEVHPIALGKGEQRSQAFLRLSPNGRIPAIVDTDPQGGGDPVTVFETAAILIYLAEKTGCFLPADLRGRTETLEWLIWQVAGLGPMLGQHGHFALYATEKIPYAIERYRSETLRLYGVMDRRLEQRDWLAAGQYTIADMACFPWIQTWKAQSIPLDDFPGVKAWYERLKHRPALRRGMDMMRAGMAPMGQFSEEVRRNLFGTGTPE